MQPERVCFALLKRIWQTLGLKKLLEQLEARRTLLIDYKLCFITIFVFNSLGLQIAKESKAQLERGL